MNQDIRSIVERARAGDQVAMALIVETRKQAAAGNRKAQQSKRLLEQYIDKYPASAMAGDEASASTNQEKTDPLAQQALWKARKTTPERWALLVIKAAPVMRIWDIIMVMAHGPTIRPDTPLGKTIKTPNSKIARCARQACRLQRLADPKVPISSYCRVTGTELGE